MISDLLASFTSPLFHAGAFPMSLGDLLGFATGLACVAAAARGSILNFPLGLINCSILGAVFLQTRLYGDMALQFVFFVLTSIGWVQWLRSAGGAQTPPSPARKSDFVFGAIATLLATLALRKLLLILGGAAPWPDAFITSASLWAQWLLNRKSISTWAWWIAVDIVSIPLYLSRQIPLIAALYAVFLVLCVLGWSRWRKEIAA